jgi:hypothetical protein
MPYLSPYLSYLLSRNIKEKLRDYWESDERGVVFEDRPQKSRLTIEGLSENPSIEIRKVRFGEQNSYYGEKEFSFDPDQVGENGCTLNHDLFINAKPSPDPNLWEIRAIIPNQPPREVFFPMAAFSMSKIAGKDNAEYRIEFTGYDNPNRKTQIVKLVDESDMGQFLLEPSNEDNRPYAKTKVDGTNTWLVWFLEN